MSDPLYDEPRRIGLGWLFAAFASGLAVGVIGSVIWLANSG